jgi:hypothetical protein
VSDELKYLQPVHPEWEGPSLDFLETYRPLVRFTYWLRQEKPSPILVPDEPSDPRRCAVCELTEPLVSFREIAHLLPASLGNRTWISREECDGCNHTYEKHENELASMLTGERVMGRVRARSGTAKIKAPGGRSSIGGGSFDGPLLIGIDASDPSVTIEHFEEEKSLKLTFPQPAFRPFVAIRSLVRACWLGMTTAERERHGTLHDFVKGGLDPEANELFDLRAIGGTYSHVMLHAWERSPACTLSVPRFILRFCFVNRVLIWTAPDPTTRRHLPGPLPFLPFISDERSVRGTLRRGASSVSFTAGTITQTVTYQERVRGDVPDPRRPKPPRVERDVRLEFVSANAKTTSIDEAHETTYEADPIDQRARFRVAGGRLAGALNIRKQGAKLDVSAQVRPEGHSTSDVRRTCQFMSQMLKEGGTLSIIASTETRELEIEAAIEPWDVDSLEKQLEALGIIEREFGVEFTFPDPLRDDYVAVVDFLASAICAGGVIVVDPPPFTMTIVPEGRDALLEVLRLGADMPLDVSQDFVVFGQDLGLVAGRMTLVSPSLVQPSIDDLSSRLLSGEQVEVTIAVAKVIHEFPQWKRDGAVPKACE